MKVAFFGTPCFAVPILRSAVLSGHEVTVAISQPDRPVGRKQELHPVPVKTEAIKSGIPVIQPESVKSPEFLRQYKTYCPDINIVAAFGQIMPDELLYFPKFHSVNIHASLLPKYRGASPINRAIINGEAFTGISYQMMETKLDRGDVIFSSKFPIADSDTSETLFSSLSDLAARTLPQVLDLIQSGRAARVKQDDALATYAGLLKKEDGLIDFDAPSRTVFNLIRGLLPWPCAYSYLDGQKIKIFSSEPLETSAGTAPGTVTGFVKNVGFTVECKGSSLLVKEVSPEGGKRMPAWDFFIGRKNLPGKTLKKM